MDLAIIVNDLIARADDLFPAGTARPAVRVTVAEELDLEYPSLAKRDRALIAAGVIAQLEVDDHFGWEFCGDPFTEEPAFDEAD